MGETEPKWYDIDITLVTPMQSNRVVKIFAPGISNPVPVALEGSVKKLDNVANAIGSIGIIDSAPPEFPRRIPGYPTPPSVVFTAAFAGYRNPREGAPLPYILGCHHHSYKVPTIRLSLAEKLPMEPKLNKGERKKLVGQGYTLITREYVVSPLTPALVEFFAKHSPVFLAMLPCRRSCTIQSIIEGSYTDTQERTMSPKPTASAPDRHNL